MPSGLPHGAFKLAEEVESVSLPQAIALVTVNPARTVGMEDRGAIASGRRADLLRVRYQDGIPIVRSVWRQGVRVA